jgi:hypothetical protein
MSADRKPGYGEEPPLPDKVIAIHEALRAAKIPHAIGGALALAYYAVPRATIDIDVNIFMAVERWPAIEGVLRPLGIEVGDLDQATLERDRQCRLRWGANPIDLFFAYDAIHDEMQSEARRVPFGGASIPILAPEHLLVCKAMFDRRKDWLDIEQMLIAVDDLDMARIESWLERMVGGRDARLQRFHEAKEALRADPLSVDG